MKSRTLRSSRMTAPMNSFVSFRMSIEQLVVDFRELLRVRLRAIHQAQVQPLLAEVLDERRRLSDPSASAATCARRTAGSCSCFSRGQPEQLLVRHAAPEEIREPRGQLVVADLVDVASAVSELPAVAWRSGHPARCGTGNSATPARPSIARRTPCSTESSLSDLVDERHQPAHLFRSRRPPVGARIRLVTICFTHGAGP